MRDAATKYTIKTTTGYALMTSGGGNKLHFGLGGSRSTLCYNGGGMGRLRDRGPITFYSLEAAEAYAAEITPDAICTKCSRGRTFTFKTAHIES